MRPTTLAAALTITLLATTPAFAGVKIDVRSEDGDRVHLSFGSGMVAGLVRALAPISIDCDEDRTDEPKVRELYLALDRAGEPSRGTLDNGDEFLDARRDHGKLHLRVTDDDGEVADLTMPWAIARCVLGGERISRGELAHAIESGDFSLHVVDGDDVVRIEID
jgi:hypothetical protein